MDPQEPEGLYGVFRKGHKALEASGQMEAFSNYDGKYLISCDGTGTITPWVILGILYLGVISTGLAVFPLNTVFAHLESGVASLTFFTQPVVGVGLGALLLGEQLTGMFLLEGALIGIGLILAAGDTVA